MISAALHVEGVDYGYMNFPDDRLRDKPGTQWASHAFFCPTCARVWATAKISGRDFMVWSVPCKEHPRFFLQPAGSIWLSWDRQWNDALPLPALKREVSIHLKHRDHYANAAAL